MIEIIKEKTCAVTGHRIIKPDLDKNALERCFETLILGCFDTFLIGMAIGFDTLCFQILERFRKKYPIKIIACIPCVEQDKCFTLAQKKEYKRMISVADDKVILCQNYTPYCMMARNKFMVDNSVSLVAYLNENKGGTFSTVKYAKEKGVSIIKVNVK